LGYAQDRAETHDVRAGRWDFVSSSTRLVVALSAAVSSISLLADNTTVTLTFSLLTAIISALNAAFNPPDAATHHRQSAKEYSAIVRRLDLLWRRVPCTSAPSADTEAVTKREYSLFLEERSRLEVADDRAPAINRVTRRHISQNRRVAVPQSWWQLRRYKRSLSYKLSTENARRKYEKDWAELKRSYA
jgi:hypothetical protein